VLIDETPMSNYCPHLLSLSPLSYPRLFSPNIWHPPCSKLEDNPDNATRMNQPTCPFRLSSTPNLCLKPSTQILSTIVEGSEHSNFSNIPKVHLHQPTNMSTTAAGSSQNGEGASSTQTNGGAPHQSPLRAPSPIQVIQPDVELDQV
jgi:hypothetical protein